MKFRLNKRQVFSLALMTAFTNLPFSHAQACTSQAPIGSVCITAGSYCPDTFLALQGQTLSKRDPKYKRLALVLDNKFGGEDNTFMLPNGSGRELVGSGKYYPYTSPTDFTEEDGPAFGAKIGAPAVALEKRHIPQHTHEFSYPPLEDYLNIYANASNTTGDKRKPEDNYFAVTPAKAKRYNDTIDYKNIVYLGTGTVDVTITGGFKEPTEIVPTTQKALPVIAPQLGLNFCIKATE